MARKDEQGLEALGMWSALTAALGAIRTPALLFDPTGTVVHANPAASALLAHKGLPPFSALLSASTDRRASEWRVTTLGDPPERFGFIAVLDSDHGAWRQRPLTSAGVADRAQFPVLRVAVAGGRVVRREVDELDDRPARAPHARVQRPGRPRVGRGE